MVKIKRMGVMRFSRRKEERRRKGKRRKDKMEGKVLIRTGNKNGRDEKNLKREKEEQRERRKR